MRRKRYQVQFNKKQKTEFPQNTRTFDLKIQKQIRPIPV